MATHAPHIAALKASFLSHFNRKLSIRRIPGRPDEYQLSVTEFADHSAVDRVLLVKLGAWLESRRYYLCHDYGRVGVLGSPDGWTYWKDGVSVCVRYYYE